MGSGASKKKDEPVKPDFDDDYDDDDLDDVTAEVERRRREFQKRDRLEKAGKLPQIGGGEANRKIVGLVDSDDEDEGKRKHWLGPGILGKKVKKQKSVEQEDKLAKELRELEQTFKSFEDDERKGWGLNRSGTKPESTQSAFTSSNRYPIDNHGSWSASPPMFPRNAPKTGNRGRAGPTPLNNSKPTLTRTLKFSWDEQPTMPQDKNSDEWTYKQTVINGFDPDKFRRVNKKNNASFDSDIRIERSMPGVPSYDPTEKQLLATIEHELGVL